MTNGGGIRADKVYPPGTRLARTWRSTRRDILSELPFGNKTVLLEPTGRELRAALETASAQADWVTVIDLTLDEVQFRGRKRFVWSPAFRAIHTGRVTPEPRLAKAVRSYSDRLSRELDVEIGTTDTDIGPRSGLRSPPAGRRAGDRGPP